MTSYDKIWDTAEDNHGIITSSLARGLGVKPAALMAMSFSAASSPQAYASNVS